MLRNNEQINWGLNIFVWWKILTIYHIPNSSIYYLKKPHAKRVKNQLWTSEDMSLFPGPGAVYLNQQRNHMLCPFFKGGDHWEANLNCLQG